MSYTWEEFHREYTDPYLKSLSPEVLLKELSPEERLKGLSPDVVFKQYQPEERLEGLSPEVIEKYLSQLKKNQ